MGQASANGRIASVKMFDDDMRAEIRLLIGGGELKLKLTDNQQSAFSGMVSLASSAMQITMSNPNVNSVHVEYDEDDREISFIEVHL